MHGRARGKGKLVVRAKLNRNMKLAGCPSLVGRKTEVRSISDKYRSNCAKGKCCDERGALCWYSKDGKVRYGNAKRAGECCEDGVRGVCVVTPVITSIKMVNTLAVGNPNNAQVMITFNVPVGTGATGAGAINPADLAFTLTGADTSLGVGTYPDLTSPTPTDLLTISSTKFLATLAIDNGNTASGAEVLSLAVASGSVIKASGVTNPGTLTTGASVRLTDSTPASGAITITTNGTMASKRVAFITITASGAAAAAAANIAKIARVASASSVLSGNVLTYSVAEVGRTATTITVQITASGVAAGGETASLRLVGADGVTIQNTIGTTTGDAFDV